MRNQGTELQGQLQNLHQKNTWIKDRWNQIQITNSSIEHWKSGKLAQQLQTSNFELSRLQTEDYLLRKTSKFEWRK